MAVTFINITRDKFLKDFKKVYRFTSFERFMESLNSRNFTFVNPTLWTDPFEKYLLERDFQIDSKKVTLPAKNNVFSVCVSGTLSSEAYWKVYAPKEDGIRLSLDTEKFLNTFLDNIDNCDVYIGKVEYRTTKKFYEIDFDTTQLVKEIQDKEIGEQQIHLLLKKRNSFRYENEVRIIVVPKNKQNDKTLKVDCDITQFTTAYTIDPRLGQHQVKVYKDYFRNAFSLNISHSKLYADLLRHTIILK
jgi:hypothetical protein